MSTVQRHPGEPPMQVRSGPYPPPRPKARLPLWFHLLACLLVWPAVFATIVIAEFVAVVIVYDTWAGPLFWPIAWILSAIVYGLFVGVPLAICGRRQRPYLRLIPAVTAAAPFVCFGILVGIGSIPVTATGLLWLIPAMATIALSILVQTARWWRAGNGE
ncbi:hypothetical protein [Glycomyces sp. YM15]|uniref:hypothetical protein n=1 Tax=Glycomyces sp. YM15 TaxID=2800446 RepID=UPI001962A76E|nr:hypothetical protein [Glycomyces sp. YM15]